MRLGTIPTWQVARLAVPAALPVQSALQTALNVPLGGSSRITPVTSVLLVAQLVAHPPTAASAIRTSP